MSLITLGLIIAFSPILLLFVVFFGSLIIGHVLGFLGSIYSLLRGRSEDVLQ